MIQFLRNLFSCKQTKKPVTITDDDDDIVLGRDINRPTPIDVPTIEPKVLPKD
jgi:hypothetical protein